MAAGATNSILPAVMGLFGVLIGGAITAGSNYILAVRKERADERKDNETRAREFVRAQRLIVMELVVAGWKMGGVINRKGLPNDELQSNAWSDYRAVLAPELKPDAWTGVALAYEGIALFNQMIQNNKPEEAVTDQTVDYVSPLGKQVDAAIAALRAVRI